MTRSTRSTPQRQGCHEGVLSTEDKSIEELKALLDGYSTMEGVFAPLATRQDKGIVIARAQDYVNLIDGGAKKISSACEVCKLSSQQLPINTKAEEWLKDVI